MAELSVALAPPTTCFAPKLYDLVTEYCFDQLPAEDMIVVEDHLAVCPACGQTVDRLQQGLSVLRLDPNARQDVLVAETVGTFGVSGKLNRLFGGHTVFVLLSCAAYASLYCLSFLLELSRRPDLYAKRMIVGGAITFLWIMFTSVLGVFLLWRWTIAGKALVILRCIGVSLFAMVSLIVAVNGGVPHLLTFEKMFPVEAQIDAPVRNFSAFLAMGIFYLIIPYHLVLTLQRELQMRQHSSVLSLLRHERGSIVPRGSLYLRVGWMIGVLAPMAFMTWQNMEWYMRSLEWWPYKGLFNAFILVTWISFYALGTAWMIWHRYALNEIKRECVIVERFPAS